MRKDKQDALMWALKLVRRGNWVTFDTETTGLVDAHMLEWAVVDCKLKGSHGRTKPVNEISDGALAVHGISAKDVENAMPFTEAWKLILPLINGTEIVIFNEPYDVEVVQNSAVAHGMPTDIMAGFVTHCAMRQYAKYHGERHPRYGTYKWQNLDNACSQMGITVEGKAHSALSDALATAKIVLRLAEIAEAELPEFLRLQCEPVESVEVQG